MKLKHRHRHANTAGVSCEALIYIHICEATNTIIGKIQLQVHSFSKLKRQRECRATLMSISSNGVL